MVKASQENAAQNTYRLAQVTDDEAISQQTLSEESLKNGRQWIIRDKFNINTGEDVEVILNISENSEDSLRVISRSIRPDSAVEGEVTFNREIETSGTALSFVNAQINGEIDSSLPNANVESGGEYINPSERNGEIIELPIRSTLGVDPQGPARAATTAPEGALYRIRPGGSVHYRIESTEDDNTIEFQFVLAQRPTFEM